MFNVVEFEESGVAVVRSSWLTPRKKEVFWPPHKQTYQFNNVLKQDEPINTETWTLHKIKNVSTRQLTMDRTFNSRIERVLKILLRPNFKPKTAAQLDLLLLYLTTESGDGVVLCRNEQLWMAWFEEAVMKWENIGKVPNLQVLKLTFNIFTWVCEREQMFEILKRNNLPERLISIPFKSADPVAPLMGDEIMQLLSSIIDHKSGLQWILLSKYWETIMIKEINFQTRDNSSAIGKFIAKLIKRSAMFDDVSCEIVVQTVLRPLISASKEVREVDMSRNIGHGYNLFSEVLHDLLAYQITTKNKDIFRLFTDRHDLEKCVHTLLSVTRNDIFLYDLYKILVILSFSEMNALLSTNAVIYQGQMDLPTKIFQIVCDAANNLSLKSFLNLLNASMGCWKLLKPEMPPWVTSKSSSKLSLGYQLACLLAFPATIDVFGKFQSLFSEVEDQDDIRSYYPRNILEKFRIFSKWPGDPTKDICLSPRIVTLQHLLNSLRQYDHFQGVCLFQFLVKNIKDIIHVMKIRRDLVTSFLKQSEYIALLFQCVTELIEYFSISWNESVEALCILEHTYDFLSYVDWPRNEEHNHIFINEYLLFSNDSFLELTMHNILRYNFGEISTNSTFRNRSALKIMKMCSSAYVLMKLIVSGKS